MKILKVELQNINSLKSDVPIVIDFENELFKDVGLYAITGSTGAGKTTILDAITIALYHDVPRFKNSKGTLRDVVSHGATDAFSRVTFENNEVVHEAFWGIRLASKTGKILTNPQEEVSLKNLTDDIILASQKRSVIADVIEVTQLDYEQFLRSVMLAQGEFASFLSAKGPEKGRLLEQITGEEIYKKIGQGILDRKSTEEGKLRDIQSKINSDDVLTEERKIELKQKDKELDNQLVESKKEVDSIQSIVNWYNKLRELNANAEKFEQKAKEVNANFETHKKEFELLDLNQKAEPYKELIQSFIRNTKLSNEKVNQLKDIEEQLKQLKPKILKLTELSEKQSSELKQAEIEFTGWQPKFDLVTKLDSRLKHEAENIHKTKEKIEELNRRVKAQKTEKEEISKKLWEINEKIEKGENFVEKNKFLMDVDARISSWTTQLTTYKANKETLISDNLFVSQRKKDFESAVTELKANEELLKNRQLEIETIIKEIEAANEQLLKNKLSDLLEEQKKLIETNANWKQFKSFSEEAVRDKKELETKSTLMKTFLNDIEEVKKQVASFKKQIEVQEVAVADAQKILDLEKSIAKYEDDRQHLVKGEPCALCGSIEHPYAENLITRGVSKSEKELKERKDQLIKLNESKAKFNGDEIKLTASIENLSQQINDLNEKLEAIKLKAKELNIDCELSDQDKINLQVNVVSDQLKALTEKIVLAQKLQQQKDQLSEKLEKQNQASETLKTKDAALQEKIKNTKSEIETKQKAIEVLTLKCADLERELKSQLQEFDYELPSIDSIHLFIQNIEKEINRFNKSQKVLEKLKADKKVGDNDLANTEKQLEAEAKEMAVDDKKISECKKELAQIETERIGILPLEISVESKREYLQKILKECGDKVEQTKKQLQILLDAQREKEVLKEENNKEQKKLSEELIRLQASLELKLNDSDFTTKQEVEKALLSDEDKQRFGEIKEQIKEQQLKLKASMEINLKAIEDLNKSKNFETSEAESKLALSELEAKREEVSVKKGEIREAFRKDKEIRDRNKEIYKKIDAQEAVCNVWRELFKIIGNSKDAFNVYVQRLTLKHLLDLANVHLYKLNKRYSLKMEDDYKPKEELNFNLIDHYQTNQVRLVDTSSGGEKFIISLALALGLSDLASKNVKIDSLFIDEGFGTLDKNSLETVISTLETLQSQGKMIGIISHVENLKERIPSQIQITKASNGVSKVEIL